MVKYIGIYTQDIYLKINGEFSIEIKFKLRNKRNGDMIMAKLTLQELESTLWQCADTLNAKLTSVLT